MNRIVSHSCAAFAAMVLTVVTIGGIVTVPPANGQQAFSANELA